MALRYESDLEGKQFCIKVGVTKHFEDFMNMDGAGCTLKKRKRHGERHIEKVIF